MKTNQVLSLLLICLLPALTGHLKAHPLCTSPGRRAHATVPTGRIAPDTLGPDLPLPAMPTLYLLDEAKRVLLKETSPEEIHAHLSNRIDESLR